MFVVPIKNVSEAEAEMNGFLRAHRVLAVKKEFVPDGENSFWSFCVEYLDGAMSSTGGTASSSRPPKVDYREILTPEEFELFSRLRDWRKAAAEKEGVPVYAVLTNGHLAEVVQKKITTKAGLKGLEGVGEARMEKYGEALLRQLGVPEGPPTS